MKNKNVSQALPDVKLSGHALTYKEVSPSPLEGEDARRAGEGFARGFTLIELLVVILIIGILAAVALPQYQKAVMKTRYATLKNLTRNIATAATAYHLANDGYTDELADLDIGLTGGEFNEETPRQYVYPWGYCYVKQSSDTKITITCKNTDISMGYVTVLETGKAPRTSCYVYSYSNDMEDYPLQHQICKEETGLSKHTGSNEESHYLRYEY